ncbi:hypothetical protein [Azonexus sp.]|uniref:hypothetical protein n=1 Tax=Azonexus sp. TaxID=1872668 RepID=UPI0035B2A077
MRHAQHRSAASTDGDLAQYTEGIARMQRALQRIYANKQAISESLLRSAAALRRISAAGEPGCSRPESSSC